MPENEVGKLMHLMYLLIPLVNSGGFRICQTEGANPKGGGVSKLFGQKSLKCFLKMKEIGLGGGVTLAIVNVGTLFNV